MGAVAVVCGVPSAVSLAVFENQDWVWGLALMISGLFISIAVSRYGPERFRAELLNGGEGTLRVGPVFGLVMRYGIPAMFVAMFGWWLFQTVAVYDPDGWWNPVRVYSLGTCLLQWGVVLFLLRVFNRQIAGASLAFRPDPR